MRYPDPEKMNTRRSSFVVKPLDYAGGSNGMVLLFACVVGMGFVPWLLQSADESGGGLPDTTKPDFWEKPAKSPSTTPPDAIRDGYWNSEFQRVNKEVENSDGAKVVFFGDSITSRWSRLGAEGKAIWEDRFAKYNPVNMGNSGDITPVMLYRVSQGNLRFPSGKEPAVAVLLCGTNNYSVTQSDGGKVKWDLGMEAPPREVADGIREVAQEFRRRLPGTRVIMIGILPVKNEAKWKLCRETNRINASYDYPEDEVVFLDLQNHFLNAEGTLKEGLFLDGTHLTTRGYEVMADAIQPEIDRLLKLGAIEP